MKQAWEKEDVDDEGESSEEDRGFTAEDAGDEEDPRKVEGTRDRDRRNKGK